MTDHSFACTDFPYWTKIQWYTIQWKNSSFSSFPCPLRCWTNVSNSSRPLVHSFLRSHFPTPVCFPVFPPRVGRAFHSGWGHGKHSTQEHSSRVCCWYFIKSYQCAVSHLPATLSGFSPKSVTHHLSEFLKHLWPQLKGNCEFWCVNLSLYFTTCLIIIHTLSNSSCLILLPQFPSACTFGFSFDHLPFFLFPTLSPSPSCFLISTYLLLFWFSLSPPLLPSSFLFYIL